MRILRSFYLLALFLALAAPACEPVDDAGSAPDAALAAPDAGAAADAADGLPTLARCTDGAIPQDLPTVDWDSLLSEIITLGDPWHSAQDVLAAAGAPTAIAGKFSYGDISKDLEGERIEVWIDDCAGGYRRVGERVTDSDGRIALPLAAAEVPAIGEYGLYLRVMGDNSAARATLRVYPPDTRFIVFDIDATLTTSDTELVGQVITEILANGTTPEARAGAVDITALRHDQQGYELIYLTGRPYLLDGLTRAWLDDLGFPSGTVHLTDEVSSSWPSEGQVGEFKRGFLDQVVAAGFVIEAAYGNATSDIYAYEQVGVNKQYTFILGAHGGESDTVALGEDYLTHIPVASAEPAAEQPFRR